MKHQSHNIKSRRFSRAVNINYLPRIKTYNSVVAAFEKELSRIYSAGATLNEVPKVSYFADKANLTPGYFGDLIKRETGSSPQDIIKLYIINEAKRRLASTDADISVIAYDTGGINP